MRQNIKEPETTAAAVARIANQSQCDENEVNVIARKRSKRCKYTDEETNAIYHGMKKHRNDGPGNLSFIIQQTYWVFSVKNPDSTNRTTRQINVSNFLNVLAQHIAC